MTLIELMVVMSIIAVMLGAGLALFSESNKDRGLRAARGVVLGTCRYAKTTARNTRAPVWMRVDPEGRWISTSVRRPMASWHFEDGQLRGAMGRQAALDSGKVIDDGQVGRGVLFDDKGGHLDCGALPMIAPDQGLIAEIWYRPKTHRKDRTVLAKKGEFGIAVDRGGSLHAFVGGGEDVVQIDVKNLPIPENRWSKLAIVWDSKTLMLLVNDRPLAQRAGKAVFEMNDAPLMVGTTEMPLDGCVDEIRVDALIEDSHSVLPEGIVVSGVPEVRFDATGALDPAFHQAPATLTVKAQNGESASVTVNMLGGSQ
ncbi:MAG: prepilin-type N-terminal cleavage/methylation domain-containing protein [Planctomycetes bacterium]|nr:prepilin-type N-terminal cleavage/methylation domain-containing protein [Planctomycetota bacterium]